MESETPKTREVARAYIEGDFQSLPQSIRHEAWVSDPEMLKRMYQVEDLFLSGFRIDEICEKLGTLPDVVKSDLSNIRKLWAEEDSRSVVEKRRRSIATFEWIKREASRQYLKTEKSEWLRLIARQEKNIVWLSGLDIAPRMKPLGQILPGAKTNEQPKEDGLDNASIGELTDLLNEVRRARGS